METNKDRNIQENGLSGSDKIKLLAITDNIVDIGSNKYYISKEDGKGRLYDINTTSIVDNTKDQNIYSIINIDNIIILKSYQNGLHILNKEDILISYQDAAVYEITTSGDYTILIFHKTCKDWEYYILIINTVLGQIIYTDKSNKMIMISDEGLENEVVINNEGKFIVSFEDNKIINTLEDYLKHKWDIVVWDRSYSKSLVYVGTSKGKFFILNSFMQVIGENTIDEFDKITSKLDSKAWIKGHDTYINMYVQYRLSKMDKRDFVWRVKEKLLEY